MFFPRRDPAYPVRLATSRDVGAMQQLIANVQRVYLRIPPQDLSLHLRHGLGWVAGNQGGIEGLMLVELQPLLVALISAAAVANGWRVSAYLDTLLPSLEEALRAQGATALAQVGYAPWLTQALGERGFLSQDWVVTYEWNYQPVSVRGNPWVVVRSAHRRDLPDLVALDERIFGPIWHKPLLSFEQALARAFLFTVAEQDAEIIGYQWCDRHENHAHLTRLAVRPAWEGQGVGTRLLTEVMVHLTRSGVNWITLNTQASNLRSRMLYERHGFRLMGDRVAMLWKDL